MPRSKGERARSGHRLQRQRSLPATLRRRADVRRHERPLDRFGASTKEFHVGPEKVPVQALIGDSVDNILGIRGIGPKTAAKLVTTYGDLDGIYEHIEELKGKQKERLVEGKMMHISRVTGR